MAAMGDMLAHDTIIANASVGNDYDFAKYFTNIKSTYKQANVVFCNQEGLSSGNQNGISGYPSFNAPTQFSADLQNGAGCNLINLANNHMGDKGVAATNATIDVWSKLKPLAVSGANKSASDQNKISTFEINGIKVGFVSFADFNNNKATPDYSVNNYHDESLVHRLVSQLRAESDVVIVSMHWGVEDSNTVSADQISEANLLSSLGVDVIIGTGPHVLQKVQIINRPDGGRTIVWFSLGNMLSSQLNINELIGGIAQFDISKIGGRITIGKLSFTPTFMYYEWTATEAANNDLLARKNAMIYLLDNAAIPLSKSLFNTTIATQKQYVIDTLGPEVTVK
jgi:poly-gamma-glutamate synthesis protein (capsule biosynthesis protein)